MSERLRIIITIPLLSALLLLTEGCGKKEEPKPVEPKPAVQAPAPAAEAKAPQLAPVAPPQAPAGEPQASAQAPAGAPSATPQAPAPAGQPTPQAAPAKPALATADGETPEARVEVQELKRVSGGTVMLRFTMINDGDKTLNVGYDFGAGSTSDIGTVGGVHLIEPVGKKKYLVVRDSESKCDCSRGVRDIAAKSRVNLWARFPAPPDNVEKIGVVIPHFSPMDDVPIGR
ncbi:MAG: hypothetical protein WD688_19225 [Candidatus Binatia bacterium]